VIGSGKVFLGVFIGLFAASSMFGANASSAIFPLEEVRPGQRGFWRTVVSGSELREFELEIIGVVDNFLGPQRAAILARGLDEEQILSGPVAGMSGSPVFIDGRIVGAYAYGFTWSKEQAIIGITPIEQMLELESYAAGGGAAPRSEDALRPLPTPLAIGGISPAALEVFEPHLRALGIDSMTAPGGSTDRPIDAALEPGSAVAAVLMRGDFSAAATGTVTWVDGDQILAFGHPFLQWGEVAVPMAQAEILTVVRNMRLSYKLSNTGPLIGTIDQDRLTGIRGQLGVVPAMTSLNIRSVSADGERSYSAEICRHPRLTPTMLGMALYESIRQTMEANEQETVRVRGDFAFSGGRTASISDAWSGPGAARMFAGDVFLRLADVLDNPFGELELEQVNLTIEAEGEWRGLALERVRLLSGEPRPGDTVQVEVLLREYRNGSRSVRVDVPLPAAASRGERFSLVVGDAATAARLDGTNAPVADVDDLVRRFAERPSSESLHVFLLKQAPGVAIAGKTLSNLPPSVLESVTAANTRELASPLREAVVWKTEISLDAPLAGASQLPLTLKPNTR